MQMRLIHAAAALIAACGLAACGGGGEPTPPGGALRDGQYAGETSQGLPISFVVAAGTVRDIHFGWRAKCDDGQVHTNTIALSGGALRSSAFSSGGTLETGGIAHVQGRFDGVRFDGELSRSHGSAFGTNCLATGIDWSAGFVSPAPAPSPPATSPDSTDGIAS